MLFQKRIIHTELDIYFYITVFLCLLNGLVHRTHPLSSPKNLGEILVPIYRTQGDYHWGDISVCGLLVPKRISRQCSSRQFPSRQCSSCQCPSRQCFSRQCSSGQCSTLTSFIRYFHV